MVAERSDRHSSTRSSASSASPWKNSSASVRGRARGRSAGPPRTGRIPARRGPLWSAPRIHGERQKLGVEISQATVSRYLVRHRRPPSQTWRTFLRYRPQPAVPLVRRQTGGAAPEPPRKGVLACGRVRIVSPQNRRTRRSERRCLAFERADPVDQPQPVRGVPRAFLGTSVHAKVAGCCRYGSRRARSRASVRSRLERPIP